MKHLIWLLSLCCLLQACGDSYEETKRKNREERLRMAKEEAAALKVAVLPTLDCLPLYLMKDHQLYDTAVVDLRLKLFTAQMDCDTALLGTSAEGMVTDLVRAERIAKGGVNMQYIAATNAYWQLVSNRNSRVRQLKSLEDKMVAMTRYSVTDMLTDLVVDSAKLKTEYVFRIQMNDVHVRMQMLQNSIIDALFLTEPQATQARMGKHPVILDTRKLNMHMGVVAFRSDRLRGETRKRQMDEFVRAYNRACDSINHYGVAHYRDLVMKYCRVKSEVVDSLPKDIKFPRADGPRQTDVERADRWLQKLKADGAK